MAESVSIEKIMKAKCIIFLFLFFASIAASQDDIPVWRMGLRADINMVKEQTMIGIDDQPEVVTRSKIYSKYLLSPLSLYFLINYNHAGNLNFEARPGLLMRGSELTSISLGFYVNYYPFNYPLFITTGLENTLHLQGIAVGDKSHTSITHWTNVTGFNDNEIHTAINFGFGLKVTNKTTIDVSFTKPFKEQYGYYKVTDEKDHFILPDGKYPMKLLWMLKAGIVIYIL